MSPASRRHSIVVSPPCAVPGARITLRLAHFDVDRPRLPEVRIGGVPARVVFASPRATGVLVPEGADGSPAEIVVEDTKGTGHVEVATSIATNLHQVDNPVFDRDGNLYVTYSGARGQRVPVSIFRVRRDGTQEPFVSGIVNATSLAFGPDDRLYVSSRFEGKVYRVDADGRATAIGTDLGVACGLAFAEDGSLFVGDRSGTILRLDPGSGDARPHASIPPSVAAFHLAIGPDRALYVTAPTLAPYDHVYRIETNGAVEIVTSAFGRPQGLAFDRSGVLHVVEAAAGWSGVYRVAAGRAIEQVVAATNLVGLAFDPGGGLVVTSNDTAYRFLPSSTI
jgi:sugar lactone lactonase YvrE